MKIKMKNFGKMSSMFEFSISRLGYMKIFIKIWEKNEIKKFFSYFIIKLWLWSITSLSPDEDGKKLDAKNEDEDEKIWKNEFDFWILHMKIRLYDNFHENLRKKIWPTF